MNVCEFYDRLRQTFPTDDMQVAFFVNPTRNHYDFPDVQFIYQSGALCGVWKPKADTFVFVEPLAGPFYQLPVAGLELSPYEYDNWRRIRVVVHITDGSLSCSWFIGIRSDVDTIRKELSTLCNNKWYTIEQSDLQWTFTKNGELV